MRSAEGDLLRLREILIDVPVQLHLANVSNGSTHFFRPDFCSVQDIEVKVILLTFLQNLDAELPLRDWNPNRVISWLDRDCVRR